MYQRKNLKIITNKRLVGRKAQFPKSINKLQNNFNLSLQQLTQNFQLLHTVALERYVKAFQYKVLNGILYTNSKLYQIGYISSDLCSFCTRTSETLYHLFHFCPFSKTFWSDFESFWHLLTNEKMQLSLQDIIVGVVTTKCTYHHLLNYMLLIGKVYLWVCRANKTPPIKDTWFFKKNDCGKI